MSDGSVWSAGMVVIPITLLDLDGVVAVRDGRIEQWGAVVIDTFTQRGFWFSPNATDGVLLLGPSTRTRNLQHTGMASVGAGSLACFDSWARADAGSATQALTGRRRGRRRGCS